MTRPEHPIARPATATGRDRRRHPRYSNTQVKTARTRIGWVKPESGPPTDAVVP